MHLVYNFGIFFYGFIVRIAAIFNPKAKKWVNGRQNWRKNIVQNFTSSNTIWFHCASLGEFEQGRPLMEEIRKKYPTSKIVVTFFSPSGYEIRKNYQGADFICYLPLDTPRNARDFIKLVQPEQVFFVKYEFWANYLFELKKQHIPTYCVSGLFRKEQRFFKKNNEFFKRILSSFTHFFVQNNTSRELLESINFKNVTVSGDTRYDRVLSNAEKVEPHQILERFKSNEKVWVIGSSWSVDEELLFPLINSGEIEERIIIAPHEVHESHISSIEKSLTIPSIKLSECSEQTDFGTIKVLIIDCIGLLANAYYYGNYAYVGGAFGKGLHNILEPAVFGLPVIFGPNHSKFPEATLFIDAGVGFSINNLNSFVEKRNHILNNLKDLSVQTKEFIVSNSGATNCILKQLKLK